ncbi:hypothetical protein [Amycolatopsis magusensis]|uniref:hypothetical protein n=1 Tax=Amycolatopsis magusensis TaxID=882444 RepID=UPI0037B67D4A
MDNSGSREVATHDIDRYDFVFPSGQPPADLIMSSRLNSGKEAQAYVPFVSPIVLATYRPYALALHDAGVATPMDASREHPLYYEVDISAFVGLTEQGKRWNDIGVREHGIQNNNLVLAHTSDVCLSNSGGTYQGLIAYAKNGSRIPAADGEVTALAESLKPLYRARARPPPTGCPTTCPRRASGSRPSW